jgi:RNA polymerase sigma-70 factor (ECF subfamily)
MDRTSLTDEIAEGVKAGDPDAVGAVYVALADRLLGYLLARVRDRSTAEDLLEATFLELLQKGHGIRGGGAAIKVWLFRAAHFNALDHLRKVRRRGDELRADLAEFDVADAEATPEEAAISADTARQVRAAMEALSDDQRQVLLLRYVAGLTAPEVATILKKTPGAVRSLQHRGERALARVLAPAPAPLSASSRTPRAS